MVFTLNLKEESKVQFLLDLLKPYDFIEIKPKIKNDSRTSANEIRELTRDEEQMLDCRLKRIDDGLETFHEGDEIINQLMKRYAL